MRCAEVIRELAVPNDRLDATALAEHLSSCPSCAVWAQHAVRFDEIWKATRPREPGEATWDAMWTDIVGTLDMPPSLREGALGAGSAKVDDLALTTRFDADVADPSLKQHSRRARSWPWDS